MEMKILKTILVISIAIFGAGFLLTHAVFAQDNDLVVQFETTPLFAEANFLPGQDVTRWVKAINNSGQPQRVAVEAINIEDKDSLGNVLNLEIKQGADILYNNTVANFFASGEIYLGDITAGHTTQYDFNINFAELAGNQFQGKTLNFDIFVGFQGFEGGAPPGGGGGGLPAGLTIKYEKPFYIGASTAVITWNTSYFSTSQVVYDTAPGKFNLTAGPIKYGYSNIKEGDDSGAGKVTAHSVTLTDLSPNTVYYYRTISYASPPTISFECSFATLPAPEDYSEPISEPVKGAIKPETSAHVLRIEPVESGIKKIAKVAIDKAIKILGAEFEQEQTDAEQQLTALEQTKEIEANKKEVNVDDLISQEQAKMSLGVKMGLIILLVLIIIISWLIIRAWK